MLAALALCGVLALCAVKMRQRAAKNSYPEGQVAEPERVPELEERTLEDEGDVVGIDESSLVLDASDDKAAASSLAVSEVDDDAFNDL